MIRDLSVVWESLKLSFIRDSQYASDLITAFFHFAAQIGVSVVYWYALMNQFQSIGGWGLPELILFSAVSNISPLFDLFYLGFRDLPEKVFRGDLDKHLYRPCSPIIALLSENLHFRYPIYQAATAVCLMVWVLHMFDLQISAASIPVALALLIIGVVVMRMLDGTVTLSVFWLGRIGNVRMVLQAMESLSQYPVTLYGAAAQRTLTYFLPYGLVSTYPTMALLGWRPQWWFWLCLLGIVAVWSLIFTFAWRAALKRYEAYGG